MPTDLLITAPANLERVARSLSEPYPPDPDTPEGQGLIRAVTAVNSWVTTQLPWVRPDEQGAYRPHHEQGADMLAARLYRRRATPGGIESLYQTSPVYVAQYDPDVAYLLGIQKNLRPQVG